MLDGGEKALWAHVLARPNAWLLCGPDKASLRIGVRLNLRDRLVPLERLLDDAGFRLKTPLKGAYRRDFARSSSSRSAKGRSHDCSDLNRCPCAFDRARSGSLAKPQTVKRPSTASSDATSISTNLTQVNGAASLYDDSYIADGPFALGGFIASPGAWTDFSAKWHAMLRAGTLAKAGKYHFKMNEMAVNEERMERVPGFYWIIEDHVLLAGRVP